MVMDAQKVSETYSETIIRMVKLAKLAPEYFIPIDEYNGPEWIREGTKIIHQDGYTFYYESFSGHGVYIKPMNEEALEWAETVFLENGDE